MKYVVKKISGYRGTSAATESFEREFDSLGDAKKYFCKLSKLLKECEDLRLVSYNGYMATYFYGEELVAILVLEFKID